MTKSSAHRAREKGRDGESAKETFRERGGGGEAGSTSDLVTTVQRLFDDTEVVQEGPPSDAKDLVGRVEALFVISRPSRVRPLP